MRALGVDERRIGGGVDRGAVELDDDPGQSALVEQLAQVERVDVAAPRQLDHDSAGHPAVVTGNTGAGRRAAGRQQPGGPGSGPLRGHQVAMTSIMTSITPTRLRPVGFRP
ncbi:hypothetical protein AB0M05_24995 [Streptomyces violaceusniger]|uniref:hypothetical protein n=1 Tax=Streptomyces violaceusniger TaxID=68280 RepID=UPI00341EA5BB